MTARRWLGRAITAGILGGMLVLLWRSMRVSVDAPPMLEPQERIAHITEPAPGVPPPPGAAARPTPSPRPAPAGSRLVGPSPFEERLEILSDLGKPLLWEPLPWRDASEIPYLASPSGFRATMEQLARECVLGDLRFVDCAEPPCFGVFTGGEAVLGGCRRWKELFGNTTIQSMNFTVPCESGNMGLHIFTPHGLIPEALADGYTAVDSGHRMNPRFAESLDLDALCALRDAPMP